MSASLDSFVQAWLLVAIVAAIIEVSIPHFGVVFASLAALAAAFLAFLGAGGTTQCVVFVVVLVASLALLRPLVVARLGSRGVPSRTDVLLGLEGLVTVDIDPVLGTGRVIVSGQDWAARSVAPLPAGTRIRVTGANGIVLEVTAI